MTDRELMQQALDALEEINKLSIGENAICLPAEIDGALDALRERLAQPEQSQRWAVFCAGCRKEWSVPYQHHGKSICVECEAKLKAQPGQEPVAWRWKERINNDFDSWVISASEPPPYAIEQQPLYTAPPQRQPLTDEEIRQTADQRGIVIVGEAMIAFARAIEAAHGIKGEA